MKKKALIAIIIVVAIVVLAGAGTAAFMIIRANNNSNNAGFEIADNQEFSYDGSEKQPVIANLSDNDRSLIFYSYAKKEGGNPETHTYLPGLPVDAGTYYVKVALGDDYKFTTMRIKPSDLKLEELSVVYNQMILGSDYFTSEFDINDVEFISSFTKDGKVVEGTLTLKSEALYPSISSYNYTFVPNNKNYAEYSGSGR